MPFKTGLLVPRKRKDLAMLKTILVLTALTAFCYAGTAFAGEATKVYLTCYWVCKKWKTGYYDPHCVKYVQDCKLRPERLLPPPAKTTPH